MTVVLATRNRAAWLDDCLRSLTAQETPHRFEVVVVDNASTDRTGAVLDDWVGRDARVRAVHEPRVGHSAAKNAGVAAAQGEIVLFTDDDVVVPAGWLQALHDAVSGANGREVLVGGPIVPVPDDLGPWPRWFVEDAHRPAGLLDYDGSRALRSHEYLWGANMGARREVLDRVGAFDERLGHRGDERGTFEDAEYQDRARAMDATVWFEASAWLRHRVPRSSLSPRRLLHTTVSLGALDRRLADVGRPRPRRVPPAPVAAIGIGVELPAWVLWAAMFHVARRSWVFRRAYRSAWRVGRAIELVHDDHPPTGLRRVIVRAAYRAVRLVEALLPTGPTLPGRSDRPRDADLRRV